MSFSAGTKAALVLEDGTTFEGVSFGAEFSAAGEVVFNTSMVGYPEALTDPSYRGQILVLTYPMIGNYGVPPMERDENGLLKFFESDRIQVSGFIIANYSEEYSHWQAERSLGDWLKASGVPAITGVDTRAITKLLREKGTCLGKVVVANKEIPFEDPNGRNLVAEVSRRDVLEVGKGDIKILAYDCGMKLNIARCLLNRGVQLKIVPWDYELSVDEEYDGLFISNGPGNPLLCTRTIKTIRTALKQDKPIFGICLGSQLLALAAGAQTYKLKYGNRGSNQPCVNRLTGQCMITTQNHGFAVNTDTLPSGWQEYFYNANDHSNEGIIHSEKPFMSVQFHPEAKCGPTDTEWLFDQFVNKVREYKKDGKTTPFQHAEPKPEKIERPASVLILGSGGLTIGQAGEFDYSGSQAIKALKEEGISTILINPNIGTIQTSEGLADRVYFLPVNVEFVERIIAKERPTGLFLSFGGQTALNCGVELEEKGILAKYGVKVLGTPVEAIVATEDRGIFAAKLNEIDEKIAPSVPCNTMDEAVKAAKEIGYPVIVRAAFALGGLGSGFANDEEELLALITKSFAYSPQVLVEKSLRGWKEIEYEVVRDAYDNCVTVCNMENFDPLGVHTGESIVVAPSQTLTDDEYYMLRNTAIKVIRHIGVVGECNIQYALDPFSRQYFIIEVNARLSRSSALASKATGYPLAFVAAKLALGYPMHKLRNSITKTTTACFEPSLDYCVVKVPRWDLAKFERVSRRIGSAMKSVGEVMSIGRSFEEAFQKAMRMVDDSNDGFFVKKSVSRKYVSDAELEYELKEPTDERVFVLAEAFARGYTIDRLYDLTRIDKWFLHKCKRIADLNTAMKSHTIQNIPSFLLREAKRAGFSDKQIAIAVSTDPAVVRRTRQAQGIIPAVKQIDTHGGEFPAITNYLYTTYHGQEDDVKFDDAPVVVLGSGNYRIGSSVEFDWCAVSCVRTLREQLGRKVVMINFNPETVSTDYDESDKLYFEELSFERVVDIYEKERATGVVVSVGGQIPNNIAMALSRHGVSIIGTSAEMIDNAENRHKFSSLMDIIEVPQPLWQELSNYEEALAFCRKVGFPCVVRPSYVLSGAAMRVVYSENGLEGFLNEAAEVSREHPVIISKFANNAREVEFDAVVSKGSVVGYAISEHIENAGVHSGDATIMLPPQNLDVEVMREILKCSKKIAKVLQVTGPMNIQYLVVGRDVAVIETNIRASRTFPFISKTFKTDFIALATKVMMGAAFEPFRFPPLETPFVCIKSPMFSFTRLGGADPALGVEMRSTGEVACFGPNKHDAFLKSLIASKFELPKSKIFISVGSSEIAADFMPYVHKLIAQGFAIYAAGEILASMTAAGLPATKVVYEATGAADELTAYNVLKKKMVDCCIELSFYNSSYYITHGYTIRRSASDFTISLVSNVQLAKFLVDSLPHAKNLSIASWDELQNC